MALDRGLTIHLSPKNDVLETICGQICHFGALFSTKVCEGHIVDRGHLLE